MKKVNNLFNAGYGWGRTYPLKTRLKEEFIDGNKEYMYIEALEDNTTVSFKSPDMTSSTMYGNPYNTLEYSSDQKTWSAISEDGTVSTINAGEKLYFRGECTPHTDMENSDVGIGVFVVTNKYNAGGNVMSLLFNEDFEDKTDLTGYDCAFAGLFVDYNGAMGGEATLQSVENLLLPATTLTYGCYGAMFSYCASLTTAPELPVTTLASNCYAAMFSFCTSLTTVPELPATTLVDYCYYNMFHGCSSLVTAPELPATTLVSNCYRGMFNYCTSLTAAPELPATTLADNCYYRMFHGCSSLNYIKMLATDISANDCLDNWVSGVSSIGTFVKNANMESLPTGSDGIPSGWTVETA